MTELQTLLTGLALLLVLSSAWTDLKDRRIGNRLLLAFFASGLILRLWFGATDSIEPAMLRMGVVALVFLPVFLIRGMGAGDVKLFMLLAFLLEKDATFLMVTLSLIFGGVFGILEMIRLRCIRYFSPLILREERREVMTSGRMGIPYALPIAAGTFLSVFIEGQFQGLMQMAQGMI